MQGCKLSLCLMSVCKMSTWSDALAQFPQEYALTQCYGLCHCCMWSETYKTHPCTYNLFMSLSKSLCVYGPLSSYQCYSSSVSQAFGLAKLMQSRLKSRYMGAVVSWRNKDTSCNPNIPSLIPAGEQCCMSFTHLSLPSFLVCLFYLLSNKGMKWPQIL